MKKFFTLLVVFVLILTMTASIFVSAEGEATAAPNDGRTIGTGGLDFYSVTIHYESPVLLEYWSGKVNNAAKCIKEINEHYRINTPIIDAVYNILYEGISPVIEIKLLTDSFK